MVKQTNYVKYVKKYLPEIEVSIVDKEKDVIRALKREKPDAIGISSVTKEFERAIELAKKIKEQMDVKIILGGSHMAEPVIVGTDIDFKATYLELDSNTWFADTLTTAQQLMTVVITTSLITFTLTNLEVSSVNQGEVDSNSVVHRTIEGKMGVGFTIGGA